MVVAQIEPDFRPMDRSGIASGTRAIALKLWKGRLPKRPPEDLARELYEEENQGKSEPSGSQDMVGLVYPGINRLDYDFAVQGGRLSGAHRKLQSAGSGPVVEPGAASASRGSPAGWIRSAGRKESGSPMDCPVGSIWPRLFCGHRAAGCHRFGPFAEPHDEMLGHPAAAGGSASRLARGVAAAAEGVPTGIPGGHVFGLRGRLSVGGFRTSGAGRLASEHSRCQPMNTTRRILVSGGFDNIKSRDLRFLEEASKLGELTVVLWPDDELQRLTGRPPMFPLAERSYFLNAVRYVHQVIPVAGPVEADEIPTVVDLRGAVWADREPAAIAARQKFCANHGLAYHVFSPQDLKGFPEPPPMPSVPGRKKVVATGCYDWFHSGHVRFTEEASAYGDLYVCLGNDVNVCQLKGPGHPLLSQDERAGRDFCSLRHQRLRADDAIVCQ